MVQIIPAAQRKPSFGQKISSGTGSTLENLAAGAQQHQQKELMAKALRGKGIDPNLPSKLQELQYQSQLAQPKKLTSLQQSQQALNEEKLRALQGEQKLFNNISGKNRQQNQQYLEEQPPSSEQPQMQGEDFISSIPIDKLQQLAAFAGQPGQKGVIGNMAKAHLDKIDKEKTQSPEFQRSTELAKSQAQEDSKFYKDLNERKSKQILKRESLARLENLGKKKVTGKLWESVLDRMGLTQMTSEGYREYTAEQKNQFTDFKAIAGSQLSAREFFTLASAYPNSNFTPEANQAIIDNLKEVHDTLDEEYNIAQRLKKENNGKLPEFYQEKVNNYLQKYVSKKMDKIRENNVKIMNAQYGIQFGYTLMFDQNGEPLNVPDSDVTKLLDDGLADLP